MLDTSGKKILRFSNGGGTCGNAMDMHIQSYSASAEEWPHCGIAVSVYLFQSFVLLFEFVDLSTICLGKVFAPLHCTCAVEGP